MSVLFSNNGATTLSSGVNSAVTSIAVTDGSVFPALSGSDYFYVTFEDIANSKREIVKVTARTGNTITVVRGQDGTSGTAFSSLDRAELRLNAAALNDATFTGVYSDLTGAPVVGDGGLTTNDFTDADHTKLDGIETSATADQTAAQIKTAYEAEANAFTDAQFTKLSGIETSATADQTAAEVRALVESATDSNAFTDADHTKLNAVEALADVTDTTNVVGSLTAGTNIAIAADGTISSSTAELKFNSFTGDGSTVAFTLTSSPPEHSTLTYIDGVYQNKTAYSMSGNVLTFSAAPDNGAAIEVSAANIAPVQESTEFLINQFTGNGSTVAFTLSSSPVENQTAVYISGVYQSKSNYALSGPSLTFSTAPPNTAPIEVMVANTIVYSIGQPDDGTVTTVKIAANAVTSAKIDATVASKAYVDSLVAATNEVVEDTTPQLGGDLDLNSHNITGTGNVDGRDVGTDGTKLDTVETNADVTDTANVTSSGALMDSELTSIASVKALNQGVATGDSPTFANFTSNGLDDNATSTAITIDSSQNVTLGVPNSVGLSGATLELTLGDTGNTANDGYGIGFVHNTSDLNAYILGQKQEMTVGTVGNTPVKIVTNNTPRLTISGTGAATFTGSVTATSLDISGNIDVDGTTNLDVVDIDGAVALGGNITAADGIEVRLGADNDMGLFSSSGVSHIRVNSGIFKLRADDMRFTSQDQTERMRIDSSGNITQTGANSADFLIKAPTDNASLTLQAGSSDSGAEGAFVNFVQNTTYKWQMGMNTDNSFRWYNYATSSEAMQISPSGNVSIVGYASVNALASPDGTSIIYPANTGYLGVGTASPAQLIHGKTTSGNAYMRIERASQSTGQVGLQIGGGTSSTDWFTYMPANSNDLAFFGNSAERLRINSGGDVIIGSSGVVRRDLGSATSPTLSLEGTFPAINFRDDTGGGCFLGVNGSTVYVGGNGSTSIMNMYVDASVSASFIEAGGITFNGDTATANALNDYEEGTWTPTFNGSHIGSHILYYARYTKIGNLVYASCYVYNLGSISGTGVDFGITGLPFANGTHANGTANASSTSFDANTVSVSSRLHSGVLYVVQNINGGPDDWLEYQQVGGNSHIQLTICYQV